MTVTIFQVIKGLIAGAAGWWGGLPGLTQALLMLMVIDVVFGLAVAVRNHSLSARFMYNGMTKKVGMLLLVGVASILNPYVQGFIEINLVQAASMFYVASELMSIVRNASMLGIPVFNQLQDVLKYFQETSLTSGKPTIPTDTGGRTERSQDETPGRWRQ